MEIPLFTEVDESNPMNGPFSEQEFFAALRSCNTRSVPGFNGISYETFLGLLDRSNCSRVFLLLIFLEYSFSPSWMDTSVCFIPKPGSYGFRPISFTSAIC